MDEPLTHEDEAFLAEHQAEIERMVGEAAVLGAATERARIRREMEVWLIGGLAREDAGLINGRRIVDEIERICPDIEAKGAQGDGSAAKVSQTESFLHLDAKFRDGAQLIIHIPLGRSTEEREEIEFILLALLHSWARAYHPDPCPLCHGTGDARELPTLEDLRRTSVPVDDIEDAVRA